MGWGTSSDLERQTPNPDRPPVRLIAGTVRTTAGSSNEPVLVEFVLQPGTARGPFIGWTPRAIPGPDGGIELLYPSSGDQCAVAELDNRTYWIVGWWPS